MGIPPDRVQRIDHVARFSTTNTKNGHNGTPIYFLQITVQPRRSSAGNTFTDRQPRETDGKRQATVSTPSDSHLTHCVRASVECAMPTSGTRAGPAIEYLIARFHRLPHQQLTAALIGSGGKECVLEIVSFRYAVLNNLQSVNVQCRSHCNFSHL